MTETAAEIAERYFTPSEPRFWRWSGQNCAEIEGNWEPTSLIAFRAELVSILTALQPQGWPPLSSLLLVMAASRESWMMSRDLIGMIFGHSWPNNPFVADVGGQLDRLHALPPDLRESTGAKIRLMRVIFEGSRPVLDAASAKEALQYLTSVVPLREPETWAPDPNHTLIIPRFADWTRSLRIGLARLNEEALRNRQQTGLDDVVVPAPITTPPPLPEEPATHAARLWSWSHDPQLYGIARIARQLLSVVSWPRSVSQPDDLPLGGVSDLTNRGPLDRLLLTELANDDVTLIVRIALNEALYLRRECPRHDSPVSRMILVDAGLRMWGRPRVFGAAVALAMAAAQDRETALSVQVAVTSREGWQSADVSTRAGAMALLGALSPTLHPGELLEDWRAAKETDAAQSEFVLVTTPDVFRQPEFQQQLRQLPTDFRIALVDGQGRFELRSHSSHGWRTECTAELDLDELLQAPPDTRSLPIRTSEPDRYPVILRTEPFPLLLTHQLEPQFCFPAPDDKLISLASGGRVLLWTQPQRGGRQLAIDIPRGRVETWSTRPTIASSHGRQVTAVLRAKQWTLLTIDLEYRSCKTVELKSERSPADPTVRAVILPECVIVMSKRGMEAFSPFSGELLAKTAYNLRDFKFYGNRYLTTSQPNWFRLTLTDGKIDLLSMKTTTETALLVDLPPNFSSDGPLEISAFGQNMPKESPVPPFRGNLTSAEQHDNYVVLTGKFEMLSGKAANRAASCAIWDLNTPGEGWTQSYANQPTALHAKLSTKFQARPPLRTKFASLACDGHGVALLTTKQHWWRFMIVNDQLRLVLKPTPSNPAPAVPFERLRWPGMTLTMHAAKLDNGNTVWLDSRGLLHLLPADTQQPEISLVLDANAISGWMSDGRQFGDAYYLTNFLSGVEQLSVQTAWQTLIAPFFGVPA